VGVLRSVVLGRALAGAEAVANAWLRRLAGDRPVELRLGADDKGKVLFHVHGFGGEDGYRTASTGERRLIDAPTLLALAELSGGARGATGGTLFLDEAFDALDAERRTAFAAVLRVVAEQRCVVVATHAPEREALCPVAKYAVEAGALRRI
jgi:DNA repair exonuclease SbcCD ATPase subunit